MLKVMIVDDEIIVRVGFQSCVRWEDYDCQVIATCASGKEAAGYFQTEVPDIVFTDILMPEMNGIELLRFIRTNYPRTKVVVLSCLSDMEYVKQAMKLGAEDYILKLSFTKETMVQQIVKLKEIIESERSLPKRENDYPQGQSLNREQAFRALLSPGLPPQSSEVLLGQLGYRDDPDVTWAAACFLVDRTDSAPQIREADSYLMQNGLLNIIREFLSRFPSCDLSFLNEKEIAVLFQVQRGKTLRPELEKAFVLLNEAMKTHLNLTVSCGFAENIPSFRQAAAEYARAENLAGLRFFQGGASFHCEEHPSSEPFAVKRSFQRRLQEAIYLQNEKETAALIDEWFEKASEDRRFLQIEAIKRAVVEAWIFISGNTLPEEEGQTSFDEEGVTSEFWNAETIAELKAHFQQAIGKIAEFLAVQKNASPEISRLLHYLEGHIDENLTLEEAAGMCALGRSQFCVLFKKNTGETFVNYVNQFKMKKAFELLASEHMMVQEAADRIGMHDLSYFNKLFKKYYNMTPSEVKRK